jgi:hypothetical protein
MMIEQTIDKLRALRLSGMVEAYRQQTENPDVSSLSFEERLGLMVDQHWNVARKQGLGSSAEDLPAPNRALRGGHQLPLRPPTGRSQAALAVEL